MKFKSLIISISEIQTINILVCGFSYPEMNSGMMVNRKLFILLGHLALMFALNIAFVCLFVFVLSVH